MKTVPCPHCEDDGRVWLSRHGGNDPDTYDAGVCGYCLGTHQLLLDDDEEPPVPNPRGAVEEMRWVRAAARREQWRDE